MKTIPILILVLGAASSWAQDVFKQAEWKPKAGEDVVWAVEMKFTAIGQDASFTGKAHRKTVKVNPDASVEIESWMEDGVVLLGGSRMDQPGEHTTHKVNAQGEPVEKQDFKSSTDELFSAFATLRLPEAGAKPGDKWEMADPLKRFGKGQAEFTGVTEFAGKKCLTSLLDYTLKSAGTANGKVFVDAESGVLVGFEFSFSKVAIGPGIESDGTATLKLVQ